MENPHHPDATVEGNKIIRHYSPDGTFADLSVDQTIALSLNRWKGWVCSAGNLQLYIGYDGDIFRGNCRQGGSLGNVYGAFELPKESWITCQAEFCGCGSDVLAPKALKESSIPLLANLAGRSPNGPSMRAQQVPDQVVGVETAFQLEGVRVQWDIGRRCNYSCSYCWDDVHNKTEAFKSFEMLKTAADRIINGFGRGRRMMFQFGGGEPTIYPGFLDLVRFLKFSGHTIVLTTNGSRHANFWADMIDLASVNISVHFESANLEKLLEKVRIMIERKKMNPSAGGLELKIMSPPGFLERSVEFRDALLSIEEFEKYASWSLVPIRHPIIDRVLAAKVMPYDERELRALQTQIDE